MIEEGAVLGPDCEIGPHAMIGSGVSLGARCRVQAFAVLTGSVTMGDDNLAGYGAVIGAPPQDFAFRDDLQSGVKIGNGNTLREHVTIHRGTKEGSTTEIGDGNYLMCGVHVGHNCRVGNRAVIANNCLLAGYVEIGDGAVLGGGTAFHQFIRIGRLCMVRGGTRIGKDVPPFLTADDRRVIGLNAIGLRRAGIPAEARRDIRRAFAHVYQSGKNVTQALDAVDPSEWGPEALEIFAFIRGAKRGISGWIGARSGSLDEEL